MRAIPAMLFVLIPIAWLAVLSLLVAVCRVAAEGDSRPVASGRAREELIGIKLTLSSAPAHTGQRRLHGRRTLSRPGMATGRRRIAARTVHPR
jgi:hypothetical protein